MVNLSHVVNNRRMNSCVLQQKILLPQDTISWMKKLYHSIMVPQ